MSHSPVRFSAPVWMEKLIPIALGILLLVLLAALVITGLALIGITPSA